MVTIWMFFRIRVASWWNEDALFLLESTNVDADADADADGASICDVIK